MAVDGIYAFESQSCMLPFNKNYCGLFFTDDIGISDLLLLSICICMNYALLLCAGGIVSFPTKLAIQRYEHMCLYHLDFPEKT